MVLVLIDVRRLVLTYYLENMDTRLILKESEYIEMDTSQAEVPTNENWIVISIYLNSFQVHTYNFAETYL